MRSEFRILLLLAFLFTLNQTRGQRKEGNVWYFGLNAGLDFNYTPPKALTNGALNTQEGCASICNKFGNLLFYTDGIKIYDKTHAVMPNGSGLTGSPSSTQSGIIVPNPDSPSVYYVFSTSGGNINSKTAYSIVDTALNSGNGDVRVKNVQLHTQAGEKLTAIKHRNGKDIWVLTHQNSNKSFFAYLVTGAGVNSVPVISVLGQNQSNLAIGYLKCSPDGKKLAGAEYSAKFVETYDFNSATGEVTNAETLLTGLPYYGVEFSPSGRYLYVSTVNSLPAELYQFDMKAGSSSAIIASKRTIQMKGASGALQLAPDGKIYMANAGSDSVGIINYPEEILPFSGFKEHAISIQPKKCTYGLPTFIQSFFHIPSVDIGISHPVCNDLNFNFFINGDTGDILSSHWDFGDGTTDTGISITKTYASHGTYAIKNILAVGGDFPYTDTFYQQLKTLQNPVPGINIISKIQCFKQNQLLLADTTRYYNNSRKGKLTWIFSDSAYKVRTDSVITKKFAFPGEYAVKIISVSDEGCADSVEIPLRVYPMANPAMLYYSKNCLNTNMFAPAQYSGIDSPGKITGYWWDFGDGTYSTDPQPSKTYTDTGRFYIRMAVLDTNGCHDTLYTSYTIFPSPLAGFTAMDVCSPDSVKFVNTTASNGGTIAGYNWKFGDGEIYNGLQKNKVYADTGRRTISLIAKLTNGCTDTFYKTVYIKPSPKAAFEHSRPCTGKNILFTDKTLQTYHEGAFNTWYAGDGREFKSAGDTTISYLTTGLYTVKLVATSANGCIDSASKKIYVNPRPQVDFGINNPTQCLKGNNFEFNSIATTTEGRISHYEWALNDVIISNQPYTDVHIPATGTHTVSLRVATDSSCSDSVMKQVLVHPRANMQIEINDTSQCEKDNYFVFNNTSFIPGGTLNYRWIFSTRDTFDGDIAPPRSFTVNGRYQMQVIATSDQGCRDTSIHFLSVNFNPEVDFITKNVCVNDSAFFENLSLYSGGNSSKWLWEFGDGKTSDKKEPFHLYASPGYYKVTLTGISTDGCSDTLVKDSAIQVIEAPAANFIMDSYEVSDNRVTATFKNLSTGASELYWTFGNGNFSTDENPVELFNDTGKYTISLSAFNNDHCFSRYDLNIHLLPENDFYIPNAFTPNSDPLNPEFKISGNYFYTEFEMFIYDRWGELVFYSNNPDAGWKGNYKGRPVPDGVYTYQVRLTSTDRKIFVYKGTVRLLR